MRAFILIALVHAAVCASISERASHCGDTICTAIYAPVCGTNGKTYSSMCQLNIATCSDPSVMLAHKGECGAHVAPSSCPSICITLWDPVCGSDGKTYGNDCNLNTAHCMDNSVTLAHRGACGGAIIV